MCTVEIFLSSKVPSVEGVGHTFPKPLSLIPESAKIFYYIFVFKPDLTGPNAIVDGEKLL